MADYLGPEEDQPEVTSPVFNAGTYAQDIAAASISPTSEEPADDTSVNDRRGYIGGSDAAVVAGLSPWKSPFQLFLEKTGQVEPDDLSGNERVKWGTILEAIVAEEYAERTGAKIRREPRLLKHPDYRFIAVHVDRRILNENAILECKTAGVDQASKWGDDGGGPDEVPEYYVPQAMHTMLVTGCDRVDVAVLIGGNDFRTYTIERDEEYLAALLQVELDFWQRVMEVNPPDVESTADALAAWPRARAAIVEGDGECYRKWNELQDVSAQAEVFAKRIDELKAYLMERMKDVGDTLMVDGQKLCTWKEQKGRISVDRKKLEAEYPEVYEATKKQGNPFRTFRLTKRGK